MSFVHVAAFWPIALVAALGGALCLERLHALFWLGWRPIDPLLDAVETFVAVRDREGALDLCARRPWVHLSWLASCGLSVPAGWSGEALSEASAKLLLPLGRRTELLGTLANTALLLGLVGTVHGMMRALWGIAVPNPETMVSPVAWGVGSAVESTWLGLCVAIPLLVARGLFREREATLHSRVVHAESRLRGML